MTLTARNIRPYGDARLWVAGSAPEYANDGEMGYELNGRGYCVRHNGAWYEFPAATLETADLLEQLELLVQAFRGGVPIDAEAPLQVEYSDLLLELVRLRRDRKIPYETPVYKIPGIGAAAAYASGDAFGTGFWVDFPKAGIVDSLTFLDLDNEGLAKTIYLFEHEMTTTIDNAVFAPTDTDLLAGRVKQINLTAADFVTHSANQMATVTSIGLPYYNRNGRFWIRLVTRGADNIAAGKEPALYFGITEPGE